jgi:hypothetical protein
MNPISETEPDVPEPVAPVAAAISELNGLEHRPLGEHVAAFDRVHLALTDALSAIDGV